jgi:2-polyprenyl-3-methyl-5-hydroxy-6-metoxy-1,4-benzoquinol methylase
VFPLTSNLEKISCYLCGSTKCSKIHDKIRYDMPPRPFRCDQCGFVFLYPRMTPESEKEFYEKTYRSEYDKQDAESLWESSLPEAKKRVSRFTDLYSPDIRLLEIGCASGYFLSEVKEHVKSVIGVELTKNYVKFARDRGLDVKESLDEVVDHSCDLIFMFHVLEHIEDPIHFLEELKKKLSPTGKLVIEVPNVEDVLVSVYKIQNHLDFYWEIAHNYYFSKQTLETVLEKAGFRYEIFPLQRYDLSNHMYWMLNGKPGGQGFFNFIFPQSLLNEYESALKEKFLCDTIYAIAKM